MSELYSREYLSLFIIQGECDISKICDTFSSDFWKTLPNTFRKIIQKYKNFGNVRVQKKKPEK